MTCKGCNYENEYNEPWSHGHECGKVIVSKNVNSTDMTTIRERIGDRWHEFENKLPIELRKNGSEMPINFGALDEIITILQELHDRLTATEQTCTEQTCTGLKLKSPTKKSF